MTDARSCRRERALVPRRHLDARLAGRAQRDAPSASTKRRGARVGGGHQAAAVHAECENAEANRDDVMRELNQVTEVVAAARQSLRGGKIREARLHKISEQKQLAQLQLDNTLREFAMLLDEDEQESRTK